MFFSRFITPFGIVVAEFIGKDEKFAAENLPERYQKLRELRPWLASLNYADQVHGDSIALVDTLPTGSLRCVGEADILLTHEDNTGLLIRTADCIPILFLSRTENILGAVHAGWRGLKKKALSKALAVVGAKTQDLQFVVGPFIAKTSYEVDEDVRGEFNPAASTPLENGKYLLDLKAVLMSEFDALGVESERVLWQTADTLTSADWYSARAGDSDRNFALIYRTHKGAP